MANRTEVGFKSTPQGEAWVLLPVHVNGRGPHVFLLDTGASTCLLSERLAGALDIRPVESREGLGAGGRVTVAMGHAGSVAVGGAAVEDVAVGITDDALRRCSSLRNAVQGILGFNYLRHFRITIDHPASTVVLERGAEQLPDLAGPGCSTVGFRLARPDRPLLVVDAKVNGRGPHPFLLDTGASTTVLSTSLAGRLGIEGCSAAPLGGAGGRVAASAGTVESLAVGDAGIDNLPVAVSGFLEPLGAAVGTAVEGVLGSDFLRRFQLTLDFPRGSLRLEASPAPPSYNGHDAAANRGRRCDTGDSSSSPPTGSSPGGR